MTLVDTGPHVALINRNDPNHAVCLSALETLYDAPLVTTWACVAEAMHLLYKAGRHPAQEELWNYVGEGIVVIHSHSGDDIVRMRALMSRFCDIPMDLADASLVPAAEARQCGTVFSLDSDFYIYRMANGGTFRVVPDEAMRGSRQNR